MAIAILTFIAGFLSVLAPCILPLLPIIIGGGFSGIQDKRRPYIITASLVISLIIFTILLKVSTSLIGIDPNVWSYISGAIIIILGLIMLFPHYWDVLIGRLGIQAKSQELLGKAGRQRNGTAQAILTGAALGPVFSSCSPMYAWVIATVLPESTLRGTIYLGFYCLGLTFALLLVSLLGRRILERIKWASNPTGWFQRGIAVVFILVGLAVMTGFQKTVQTYLVDKDFLNFKSLEEKLVPEDEDVKQRESTQDKNSDPASDSELFNVVPYSAPEFVGLTNWINSQPLTLDSLKGKVVLVDFWTYSCINCVRTFPYLQKWHETYQDDGFVLVGLHAPEFAFERVPGNVQNAVTERGLTYPIALDNGFSTWNAFNNRYWPAGYLIDKEGNVRREHFGEGGYVETEAAIRELLAENSTMPADSLTATDSAPPISRGQTPETYMGTDRAERRVTSETLSSSEWSLSTGKWVQDTESATSTNDRAVLKFNISAKKVYLVAGSNDGTNKAISVSFKGVQMSATIVNGANIYTLLSLDKFSSGILEITVPNGTKLNAFTFES